ncbi:TPA: LuxR family transcriptional regulator, partial [Klebsiella michiganensis]|nr:LuxR family transcriptional regulator [Klebsiella michiganensis]
LGIDHRTVYSHKLRIMKKFQLENNQELIRFSSIVMRRISLYFN